MVLADVIVAIVFNVLCPQMPAIHRDEGYSYATQIFLFKATNQSRCDVLACEGVP